MEGKIQSRHGLKITQLTNRGLGVFKKHDQEDTRNPKQRARQHQYCVTLIDMNI